MSNNISLIAFGTFGNPNGFAQTFFTGNSNLSKNIRTFDINTSALNLFPNSNVYSIRKDFVNGNNIISYSIYTYAKEKNSTRGGTFIGSSILFIDKIAEEHITIVCLNEFHRVLKEKNLQNDVIGVMHSDNFSVSKPKDFDKINFHLKEINNLDFVQTTNKQLVVYCETNPPKLQSLFKSSVDLLNVYDTIYFTESSEVAEFVHQKSIFRLIKKEDIEQEAELLQEERKRKIIATTSDFEKEVQRLDEDKTKTLRDFKEQIEQNEKLHQENNRKIRESKNDLEKVEQIYNAFSSKIKNLANDLKSGRKLDEVKKVYSENKSRFIEGISQLKNPDSINKIPNTPVRSRLQVERQYQEDGGNHWRNISREERENKIDIFKVTTIILLLLLIGTWVYLFFFNTKEEPRPIQVQQEAVTTQPDSLSEQPATAPAQELNPKPNSELNENDYRIVARELKYGTKVEDVVKIIFEKNPTDIKSNYSGQEAIYTKQIIELNKNCFEEHAGAILFTKDTLRVIPAYKKK